MPFVISCWHVARFIILFSWQKEIMYTLVVAAIVKAVDDWASNLGQELGVQSEHDAALPVEVLMQFQLVS